MNAYVSKEELNLLPTDRINYAAHFAEAQPRRQSAVARLKGRVSAFFERQRVLGELASLSDRELADIGLNRSDLSHVFQPTFTPRA